MTRRVPGVSVIVPANNAGRHIQRAIESVQAQTMHDYELIVVDAASTDRTADIVRSIAERDVRVDLLSCETDNLIDAINLGLDHARGTYVCLMGASDWMAPDSCNHVLSVADANDLQMVMAGIMVGRPSKDQTNWAPLGCEDRVFSTVEEFRGEAWRYFDTSILGIPLGKLLLRQRIEDLGLRFADEKGCGLRFMLDFVRDVERVGFVGDTFVHALAPARAVDDEAEWQPNAFDSCDDLHSRFVDLYDHWDLEDDAPSAQMVERHYLEDVLACVENLYRPGCDLSSTQKRAEVERMVLTPKAKQSASVVRLSTPMDRAMADSIRKGDARMVAFEGRLSAFLAPPRTTGTCGLLCG